MNADILELFQSSSSQLMKLRSRLESDMGSLVVVVVGHQHERVMFSCGNESQLVKNIMALLRCLRLAAC